MIVPDPQFARSIFLRQFDQLQVFLLLGSAITTVGLIAVGLSVLRQKLNRLLLWFAAFAILYGVHMMLEYQPFWWFGIQSPVLSRIGLTIGLLVPIPAFFFFEALNLLGKLGRYLRNVIWPIATTLAIVTIFVGYRKYIDEANGLLVIGALLVLVIAVLRIKGGDRDATLIRWGVLFFCACALYNNIARMFHIISTLSLSASWCCSRVSALWQVAEHWLRSRNSVSFRRNLRSREAFSFRSFLQHFRLWPAFAWLRATCQ